MPARDADEPCGPRALPAFVAHQFVQAVLDHDRPHRGQLLDLVRYRRPTSRVLPRRKPTPAALAGPGEMVRTESGFRLDR